MISCARWGSNVSLAKPDLIEAFNCWDTTFQWYNVPTDYSVSVLYKRSDSIENQKQPPRVQQSLCVWEGSNMLTRALRFIMLLTQVNSIGFGSCHSKIVFSLFLKSEPRKGDHCFSDHQDFYLDPFLCNNDIHLISYEAE